MEMKFKKDKVLAATMVTATLAGTGVGIFELSSSSNNANANTVPQIHIKDDGKHDKGVQKNIEKSSNSNHTSTTKNNTIPTTTLNKTVTNIMDRVVRESASSSPMITLNSPKVQSSKINGKASKDDSSKSDSPKIISDGPIVTIGNTNNASVKSESTSKAAIHKLDARPAGPKIISDDAVKKAIADATKNNTSPSSNAPTSSSIDYSKAPVQASTIMNTQTGVISANVPTVTVKGVSQSQEAAVRSEILALAASQNGVPYIWGASTVGQGFDCSGLTSWVYSKVGVYLPRTADEQYHAVRQVSENDAIAGDLVFFHDSTGHVYHVGIVVDAKNKMYWEANHPGGSVGYRSYSYAANSVTYGSVFSGDKNIAGDVVIPKATASPVTSPVTVTNGGEPVNYNPSESHSKNKPVSGDKPYVSTPPSTVVKVDPSKKENKSNDKGKTTTDSSTKASSISTTSTPTGSASASTGASSTTAPVPTAPSTSTPSASSTGSASPTTSASNSEPSATSTKESTGEASAGSTSDPVSTPSASASVNKSSASATNLNIPTPTLSPTIFSSLMK